MTIIAYTNKAEVIRIDKSLYLEDGFELSVPDRLLAGQDIKAPVLTIHSTSAPQFNYVYIQEFNRYYFASTPVWLGGNEWQISLICDVLYSFKDEILKLEGVASRLEDQGGHSMIIDDRITAESTQYEDIEFHEMSVVDGYTTFDMQSDISAKRIVFSCFSGDEEAGLGGPNTMTATRNGVTCTYTPEFDRYYQSVDGSYNFSGAGNYTVSIRGTDLISYYTSSLDGAVAKLENNIFTLSNINVTDETNIWVSFFTSGQTYSYLLHFTA